MYRIPKYFRLCLLSFILIPALMLAQSVGELPTPWSLESGWWAKLVDDSDDDSEKRIRAFLNSFGALDAQVPPESRDQVRAAVEKISQNTEQYLTLRSAKGWEIEEAPTPLEAYTIEELLAAAQQVKADQADWLTATDNLKRLQAVLQQARRRIDELAAGYATTPNKSLQRTMEGLSLMVAISNRAVLEERIRIREEKLAGIEQRSAWNKDLLGHAKERLNLSSLDLRKVDTQINESRSQEKDFQKELLQIEAELVPNGPAEQLDSRALMAINKLTLHSKAQVQVIAGNAKKGLVKLAQADIDSAQIDSLLESSKGWVKDLNELQRQTGEWKDLIRREQEAAERQIQDLQQENSASQRGLLEYQQTARIALANLDALSVELFQASILAKIVNDHAMQQLNWFSCLGERVYSIVEKGALTAVNWLSYPLFWVNDRPLTIFKILRAFGILALAYGISVSIRRMMEKLASRKPYISGPSLYTFNRVTHYAILLIGLVWTLSSVGIDFSNLLIIAGALSVGIGFGLQGIINNFLGGLIVLFDRKIRVGDLIELNNGQMGHISEVNVQNTVIRTLTGLDILVPNSEIITGQLTNWTLRDPFARLHLPFGVAYGSDKEKVKAVVSEAAQNVEETVLGHKTLPGPNVWLVGFGDSSLDFELVVWVDFRKSKKRQSSLRAAYYWEIETALTENGLEIPFPQRDIHLKPQKGAERETITQ